MNKLKSSLAIKIAAFFLVFVTAACAVLSLVGCLFLAFSEAYLDGGVGFISNVEIGLMKQDLYVIRDYAFSVLDGDSSTAERYERKFTPENRNLLFTVSDEDGNVIVSNGTATDGSFRRKYSDKIDYIHDIGDSRYITESFATEREAYRYLEELSESKEFRIESYTTSETDGQILLEIDGRDVVVGIMNIDIHITEDLSAHDRYFYVLTLADLLVSSRYALIVLVVVFAVLALLFLIFLIWSAGHRKGHEGIYVGYTAKVPFDIVLCIAVAVITVPISFIQELYPASEIVIIALYVLTGALWLAFLIYLIYTTAVRIKAHNFIKNTVIYRVLRLLFRVGRSIVHATAALLKNIPLYWKAAVLLLAVTIINLFFIAGGFEWFVFIWVIETIIAVPVIGYFAVMLHRLQKGARELASGNISYNVSTQYMLPGIAEHGENLNNISTGMNLAVERMTKSERMKAELITNVSHDIKTPLTSIVNYVDLLEREGLDSENAAEYLSVLSRQSARLKKLTEDLIEASKASTGNIPVNLEKTSVNVLLSQALGEYETKLGERKLETVLSFSDETPTVMADGRLLWRVIDNLLCNIYKYALEGTRVYISTECDEEHVTVVFRNISKDIISVSGSELTERFVRGDTSRNTEGSGLGLSIAEDLTRLQGGAFSVVTDGDLFKATVSFPRAEDDDRDESAVIEGTEI